MNKFFRFLPVAAILILYLGVAAQRPLISPIETDFAVLVRSIAGAPAAAPQFPWSSRPEPLPSGAGYPAALSVAGLGDTPFALRLPSAVAMLLTGLLLELALRKREPETARMAALIFLTLPLTVFGGGTAGPMAVVTLGSTLFLLAGMRALEAEQERSRIGWTLLSAAGGILLLLTAGMAGLLLPAAVLTAAAVREVRRQPAAVRGRLLPAVAGVLAATAVLPFWVLVWRGGNPVAATGVWRWHVSGADWAALSGGMLPWLLFAASAVIGWRRMQNRDGMAHLALIAAPAMLFFPGAGGMGFLPAMPFAALLLAIGLRRCLADGEGRWFDRTLRTMLTVSLSALLVLAAVQIFSKFGRVSPELRLFTASENWLPLFFALCVPLLWWHLARGERRPVRKVGMVAVGVGFLLLALQLLMPLRVAVPRSPESDLRRMLLPNLRPECLLLADRDCASAVYRLTGRGDLKIADPATFARERAAGGGPLVVVTRTPDAFAGQAPPYQRLWSRLSNLSIMEYR